MKKRLIVELDTPLLKQFKKKLIDHDITYKKWLVERINEFLKHEKKGGEK